MAALKFRERRVRRMWFLAATLVATAAALMFAVSASGILAGSPSSFESSDGNMVVDTSGNHDWANVNFFHVVDLASTQTDDSFVSGQKQDTVCPDTYGHGNPPKDDFTDIASYSETNNDSSSAQYHDTFLYGATIRYTANGSASENVELKQGKNGTCSNGLLARTLADKLIAIDYHPSAAPDFHVLTWITSSAGYDPTPNSDPTDDIAGTCFVSNDTPPCWSSTVKTLSANAAEGATNASAICVVKTNKSGLCPNGGDVANDPIGNAADSNDSTKFSVEKGQNLDVGQFAEFGVDLTAAGIIPANTCQAFPQTIWESRSSGDSFVSTTKDISIENHTISNCGEIKIIKQTKPRGLDKRFSFTSGSATTLKLNANTSAGGVPCSDAAGAPAGVAADGSFCLNDKNHSGGSAPPDFTAAGSDTANTVDENNLFPGTYSVSESSTDPNGFAFDSVTCKVNGVVTTLNTVAAPKTVTINLHENDVVVCIYQNNQQLGAIKVVKNAKNANCSTATPPDGCSGGNAPLAGAKFEVWQESNGCAGLQTADNDPACPANTAKDTKVKGEQSTVISGTGASTVASTCFSDLGFASNYYVHESAPPVGYAAAADQTASISANSTCSGSPVTKTFTDTPLSQIRVTFHSLAGAGVTTATIQCGGGLPGGDDSSASNLPDNTTGRLLDQLLPNTNPGYSCTVKIDP
jgi:hypothetical protein